MTADWLWFLQRAHQGSIGTALTPYECTTLHREWWDPMSETGHCSMYLATSLEADLDNVLAMTSLGLVDWKCGCLRKLLWRWAQPLQGVR